MVFHGLHGPCFEVAGKNIDVDALEGELLPILGDLEREGAGEAEGGFDVGFIDFEVVVRELSQLILDEICSWNRELDLAAGYGDVGIALDSFARHDEKEFLRE